MNLLQIFIITLHLMYGVMYAKGISYNLVNGLPNICICPETETIGVTWQNGAVHDKPLIQKFYSLLPANEFFVAIDIGAQTGSFSLLAKYFPNSQWYAFEPLQEARHALQKNLILNGIDNVIICSKAVADFSGKSILKMPARDAWGLATMGSNVLRFTPVSQREIECIDLDSFVTSYGIKKVHFIKIDTEGSELSILKGARTTILRDKPIILMEYNEVNMKQCNVIKQDIDNFLQEHGYVWQLVSHEDILCIPVIAH